MGDKTLNLTHEEVANFKKLEMDHRSVENRNKELLKSVELHMDLLHRAEAENKSLMLARDAASDQNKSLQETIALNSQSQSSSETTFAALKKEVVKLRKENKLFSEKIDGFLAKERDGGYQNTMGSGDHQQRRVAGEAAMAMNNLTRTQQEASETKTEERKRRKVAEEAAKALRSRTAFLLEQMEQASQLSATWKQQKTLLKAEINSLHQANFDLRERLLNVQVGVHVRHHHHIHYLALHDPSNAYILCRVSTYNFYHFCREILWTKPYTSLQIPLTVATPRQHS